MITKFSKIVKSLIFIGILILNTGSLMAQFQGGDGDGYTSETTPTFFFTEALGLTTQAVTDITATTAVGNGNIVNMGTTPVIEHGVCWNTTGNPTLADNYTQEGEVTAIGQFTSTMTGLTECTTYYAKAYATNLDGTVYGNEVVFSVDVTFPEITSTHDNVIAEAVSWCEAPLPDYTGDVIANDNCDTELTITQDPEPGTLLWRGEHTITLTATDDSENATNVTFTFTTVDTTPPDMTCPGNQTKQLSEGQTVYTASGYEFDPYNIDDNCDLLGAPLTNDFNGTYTLDGAEFPIGHTTVEWMLTDNNGNSTTCSFDVTVNAFVGIEVVQENNILIYPNPTSGIFRISTSEMLLSMKITDITGKIIIAKNNIKQNSEFDLSQFPNGVYFIRIKTNEHTFYNKIIKRH